MNDVAPASEDGITDYTDLEVAHLGGPEYRVLNWSDEACSAYEVNVETMTCSCPGHEYRRDGSSQVCKHMAKALTVAPPQIEVEEYAANSIINALRETTETVRENGGPAEGDTSATDQATTEDVSEAVQEAAADLDRVDTARDWLETGFAQPSKVNLYVTTHAGVKGVALEPDNQEMPDHVFESFKGIVNSLDGSTVHVGFGDDPCGTCGEQDGEYWYHIPDDQLTEWANE